ncbi:MAG: YqgE/AlgH family protein [Alphaproteobacteria bacterium]|nr:YqgE/AlgH family protein [Alphaproteobacteria bacterium]
MTDTEKRNGADYLAGKLLLAMPGMGDPRFHRAVIFMCAHDENGAMGLVINHKLPGMEFKTLLNQLKIVSDIEVDVKNLAVPVMSGGPVEGARGFLLHSAEFRQRDTVKVGKTYGITGTIDALREVARGNGPEHLLFILGYAGWGAGQLEREIQDNAWLTSDPDSEVIFGTVPEKKWEAAVQKLGIDPAMLSGQAGRA